MITRMQVCPFCGSVNSLAPEGSGPLRCQKPDCRQACKIDQDGRAVEWLEHCNCGQPASYAAAACEGKEMIGTMAGTYIRVGAIVISG